MKVDREKWEKATGELMERRKIQGHSDDNRAIDNVIRDYKTHLTKVFVGRSVLDVGCGGQFLRKCLPGHVHYIGIDAFTQGEGVINCAIEDWNDVQHMNVDTVCAFAVLDNCRDFNAAIANMKALARKNIVILTGLGIEVDKYHTLKLEIEDFRCRFTDWKETYLEYLHPKVALIEYTRGL